MSAVNPRISTDDGFSSTVADIESLLTAELDLAQTDEIDGVPVSLVYEDSKTGRYIQFTIREVDWQDEAEE